MIAGLCVSGNDIVLPISGVVFTVARDDPVGAEAFGITHSFGIVRNTLPGVGVCVLRGDFGRGPELLVFTNPE